MTLGALQPAAVAELDATIARARAVVDPQLLAGAEERIAWIVAGGPQPSAPRDEREATAFAVIEQMLIDVARLDDATVQAADANLPEGGLADLVMASYALEARTRLEIAAARLLGGWS